MAKTVPLAQYLFTRLRQLGVGHVHGVPGDYFLRALDYLKPAGLRWIGNCNELNAGYAADGYARIKGISALMTTYGVGELSALNAVAGSFAEYAPVVHIVGCPATKYYRPESTALLHHMIDHRSPQIYADVYKHFTTSRVVFKTSKTAPTLIDNALKKCLQESRPVYLGLPSDLVGAPVEASPLCTPLEFSNTLRPKNGEDKAVDAVLEKVYAAKQPYILVDGLVAPDNIVEEVNEFSRITGIPTLSLTFGGGIIDGSLPNYHGVFTGKYGSLDFTPYTDIADLALLFSPLLSDTNTMGWSTVPSTDITIKFQRNSIKVFGGKPTKLNIKRAMQKLLDRLDVSKIAARGSKAPSLPSVRELAASLPGPELSAPVDQDTFYLRISSFFRPGDTILCANGTPLAGGRDFVLPPNTKLINSSLWVSVGQMLPAAQGVALAIRKTGNGGRTILFEGDGSFQATAQELSTIIKYNLDAYIFLINNDGYTYERLIHGMEAEYNDVAPWNYLKAPQMMGVPTDGSYSVSLHDVGTWGELNRVLESAEFHNGKGLKMVNVRMARGDVSKNFKAALKTAGDQLRADPAHFIA